MINSVRVGDPVAYESARKVFKIVEVVEVVSSIALSTAIGLVVSLVGTFAVIFKFIEILQETLLLQH